MFRRTAICAECKFSFIGVEQVLSEGQSPHGGTCVQMATPEEFRPVRKRDCGSFTLCYFPPSFFPLFIVQRHPAGIDAQIGVPKPLRTTRCPVVVAPATTTTAVEREE